MSAMGQKRTCAVHQVMSALVPKATAKADIEPFQNEIIWRSRCDLGSPSPSPRPLAHGRRIAELSSCCSWESSYPVPCSRDCPQILAQDLADIRLRQRFEEANLTGHLVRRKFAPTVCDHLSFGQGRPPSMCHEQPYRLAGFLVWSPHASTFRNTGAGCGDCLDFIWIDVEA